MPASRRNGATSPSISRGLYYSYPGSPDGIETFDAYFELKAAASYTTGQWTFGIGDWWSPDNFQTFGKSNAIEGIDRLRFPRQAVQLLLAHASAASLASRRYEEIAADYTYWNAGLTLGFMDHYSFDVRYWDTDYSQTECSINSANADSNGRNNCDARAVGTLKAVF